jgi:hypothetical protein
MAENSVIRIQSTAHETLEQALEQLLATPENARAAVYERFVFPIAATRLRAERSLAPAAELLILPVGTQPYSPLLAALSTQTPRVALLVTEPQTHGDLARSPGSRPTAERVVDALSKGLEPAECPAFEFFSIGEGTAGDAVVRAVDAALFWAGDPWPSEVAVDVSGGRKATTSALGGIAALLGLRQFYIEGRAVVGGFYVDEVRHALSDVSALMRLDERRAATALLEAGAFNEAAERFGEVATGQCAGPAVRWLLELSSALARSETDLSALGASMPECEARSQLSASGLSATALARRFVDALRREGAWR